MKKCRGKNEFAEYECEKKKIQGMTPKQYEAEVKKLCKRLHI